MLNLKINVNLPQLLCIVIPAAEMASLSDLVGFPLTVSTRFSNSQRKTHQIPQIRHFQPQK